jgi:hypothetical protein
MRGVIYEADSVVALFVHTLESECDFKIYLLSSYSWLQ